jgi:hypothetical protein
MRLLRKLLALTPVERRLLITATLLLAVVQLGLRRLPFTALRRLLVGGRRRSGARLAQVNRALADQVAWAVTAASTRVPGPTTCLTRALTAQAMLARRGCPSRLQVGVTRGKHGEVEGHAWVECEGRILIGGTPEQIAQFTRLAAFDVEAALRLPAIVAPQGGR